MRFAAPIENFSSRLRMSASIVLCLLATQPLVTGCSGNQLAKISPASANEDLASGYRLTSGDRLRVTVFDEPNLSGEYGVATDGTVALPLISQVPAAHTTPAALASEITQRLAEGGYVLAPKVSVEVLQYKPFFILGEVSKPGEYPYKSDLTVLQAIAIAGGFTPRANKGSVTLRRPGWTASKIVSINEDPLLVGPGDTVLIREAIF